MSVIINTTKCEFDNAKVKKGDLISARYNSWEKPQNGLVAAVSSAEIRVLFIPAIGNVSNYFTIPIDEVQKGQWEIKVSDTLMTEETEGEANDA